MRGNGGGQDVIGVLGEGRGGCGVELVHVAAGERENLHVDAGGVHGGEAAVAEVDELCLDLLHEFIRCAMGVGVDGLKE